MIINFVNRNSKRVNERRFFFYFFIIFQLKYTFFNLASFILFLIFTYFPSFIEILYSNIHLNSLLILYFAILKIFNCFWYFQLHYQVIRFIFWINCCLHTLKDNKYTPKKTAATPSIWTTWLECEFTEFYPSWVASLVFLNIL